MKTYKYHAVDKSYVYNYFTGPLAGWLVNNATPLWMAYVGPPLVRAVGCKGGGGRQGLFALPSLLVLCAMHSCACFMPAHAPGGSRVAQLGGGAVVRMPVVGERVPASALGWYACLVWACRPVAIYCHRGCC
jgi:hypothetical protein